MEAVANYRYQTANHPGQSWELEYNLEVNQSTKGTFYIDAMGLSFGSVSIEGAGNASVGSFDIMQSNGKGKAFPLDTPLAIAIPSSNANFVGGVKVDGEYLVLKGTGVSYGTTGTVRIKVVLKR